MTKKKTFSLEAGFALALADLSRMGHIADVEIRDALNGAGWTLDGLKVAGADDYDVDELRKALAVRGLNYQSIVDCSLFPAQAEGGRKE